MLRGVLLLLEIEISIRDGLPEPFSQTFHRNDPLQQLIANRVLVRLELLVCESLQLQTLLFHTLHDGLGDLSTHELRMTSPSLSHRIALHDHEEPRAPRNVAEQRPHDVPHLPLGSEFVEQRFLHTLREQPPSVARLLRQLPVHAAGVVGGLGVGNGELEDGATGGNRSNSHGARNSGGERNERLGGGDDLESAVSREVAHEEPLEARGGEEPLLAVNGGEKNNGEVLNLEERNGVGLEVLISFFDGGSRNNQANNQTGI